MTIKLVLDKTGLTVVVLEPMELVNKIVEVTYA